MQFQKEDILAQLDRIISDKSFSRSKINIRLLRFLVNSTLEGRDLKEMVIGAEFFGSKYDPVKSDNKVRVYVYHLRKKLDEYYNSVATTEEIVFRIAKGQYQVQFESYQKPETETKANKSKLMYLVGAALLAISIFMLTKGKTPNDFWSTLMKNDFPTTVIFGDYFMMEGDIYTGRKRKGVIRDYYINSESQFQDFIQKNPDKLGKLSASKHQYLNWSAPYCSKAITQFWTKHDYPFEITQITQWSDTEFSKENVVYFGQTKTMGLLKNILKENFPHYSYKDQWFKRKDPKTGVEKEYKDSRLKDGKITDYTIVTKVTMPAGNEMRFFLSDQDCGAISAIDYFTDKKNVEQFYKEHNLKKEDDFMALFKVTGWLRKSYEMEFLLLDKK